MALPLSSIDFDKVDFRYKVHLRTRWVDEDNQMVLNNAIYMTLMEEARTQYFGAENLNLLPQSLQFPFTLHSANVRFVFPGKGAAKVAVNIKTIQLGASSIHQVYRISEDVPNGQVWCEATAMLVAWNVEKKCKMNMSEHFRTTVAKFEGLPMEPTAPPKAATSATTTSSGIPAKKNPVTMSSNYNHEKDIIKVGHYTEITKTFGKEEVQQFAALSEDYNPLHLDEEFAKTTQFKKCIVHGHCFTSVISGVLGMHLPGPGTVYMSQNLKYVSPVFVGDTVRTRLEVTDIAKERPFVTLSTNCYNAQTGKLLMSGECKVMYPKLKSKL